MDKFKLFLFAKKIDITYCIILFYVNAFTNIKYFSINLDLIYIPNIIMK